MKMNLTKEDKVILVQVLLRAITEQSMVSDIRPHYDIDELSKDMATISVEFNNLVEKLGDSAEEMEKLNILLLKRIAKDLLSDA